MRPLSILDLIILLEAAGSALIAGCFFGFSAFIMRALGAIPAPSGIAAMQSISIIVINPWFMLPFVGTMVVGIGVIIAALMRWQEPGAAYLVAGALLYIIGTFGVTMLFNVPRNDALANVTPDTAEAARLWATYLSEWTFWNTVRTVAALAAFLSFMMAFRVRG